MGKAVWAMCVMCRRLRRTEGRTIVEDGTAYTRTANSLIGALADYECRKMNLWFSQEPRGWIKCRYFDFIDRRRSL